MRGYALLATVLLLSGCSGFGKFLDDTVMLPGGNPNAPRGYSENMDRVRGNTVVADPILPQKENIWPSRPPALPTLSDVANDEKGFSLSDYGRAAGADVDTVGHIDSTVGRGSRVRHSSSSDFPDKGAITAGEQKEIKEGVSNSSSGALPDQIQDNAHKFIEKSVNQPIIVPNGNGTSTVIGPDGTVKTVPDQQLPPLEQSNETNLPQTKKPPQH